MNDNSKSSNLMTKEFSIDSVTFPDKQIAILSIIIL